MATSVLPGLAGYDPHDLQPWVVIVMVVMTALTVVTVALRLLSRYIKVRSLWWDDYMIIFSTLWYFLVVGFIFAMYANGMGIHADLLETDKIIRMAKWLVVAEIFYAWNLGWTKIAVLLMYYRIFHIPHFKRMAWIIGAFVMAWVITITFIFIFICVPVKKLWYPDIPGRCINQVGTWIANAASTLFTDLTILLLPIPQIWKLQLRKVEKVGLTLAFGLGFFVVFASAYRTSVLFTYSGTDPTYTLAPTVGWTAIEISAGIVSACLPTMLPVIRQFARLVGLTHLFDNIRSTTGGTSQSHGKNSTNQTGQDTIRSKTADNRGEAKGKSFYRLPDDTDSDPANTQELGHLNLHPHAKDVEVTVETSSRGDHESESGDTIPLHSIRVKNEVKQSTNIIRY